MVNSLVGFCWKDRFVLRNVGLKPFPNPMCEMLYFTRLPSVFRFCFRAPHLRTALLLVTHHLLQSCITVNIVGRAITDEESATLTLVYLNCKSKTHTHIPRCYSTIKQVQIVTWCLHWALIRMVGGAAHYQMKDERTRRAWGKSIRINLLVLLPPVPPAQKELRSMQMCAVDKDLKRQHAVDAVLLSTCTQHRLRLDIQLDLEGRVGGGFVPRLVLKLFYVRKTCSRSGSSTTRSRGCRGVAEVVTEADRVVWF